MIPPSIDLRVSLNANDGSFYRHELFLGDIALVDKAGHLRAQTSLAQMPPVNTCCGEDTHIGWFTSSNLYRVKGYSFFLSAYDSKRKPYPSLNMI